MLYEFKSRAAGTVVMTQPIAERILGIVGKAPGAPGIITVEAMPEAIAALERAVAEEKQNGTPPPAAGTGTTTDNDEERRTPVTLSQRAYPFIELLKAAHAGGKPVTWGA